MAFLQWNFNQTIFSILIIFINSLRINNYAPEKREFKRAFGKYNLFSG